MMAMFWTAVVFYICGHTVEVSGTAGKDALPASLASTVMSTALPTVTPTEDESSKLVDWLTKYGYLPPPDPSTGQLQAWTAVTQAVKKMQKFAGLEDTGVLNEETLQLMQTPRCSLPDYKDQTILSSTLHSEMQNQRMKRAVSTWARRNINWRLRFYPASSKLSRETIRSLVYYALRVWANPTLLEFHEVRGPEGTDLQIDFLHGPHGDGYPFDGPGGSVGHAFFPSDPDRAGGVHLDAEEEWAFRQPATDGTDLFTVLVHELGHALGLTHSSVRQSVMRPYYQGPLGDPLHFSLGHHDLQHITALYGKSGNHIPTDRPLLVTDPQLRHRHGDIHSLKHTHSHLDSPVDRCNTSFDAVAKIRGEIFFFKGQHMWRVSRGGLVSIRAVTVQRLWSALPSSLPPLRAVLERHTDHAIIFISGSQVWLFKDLSLQEGFPQPLSALAPEHSEGGWQGLHWDPTQGVVWGSVREDQEKGERLEESEVWRELIEGGVNGIILENDSDRERGGDFKGLTFVFKGSSYWKFTNPGSAPEEGYPRPLATDWLDCPQPSSYSPGDISLISDFGGQDLREQTGQKTFDQIRHKNKITERDKTHHWDCPCLNRAVTHTGPLLLMLVLFLITMTC